MTDPKACPECLRRSWLLGLAAPFIERASFDGRVLDHIAWLALGNRDLVASVVPAKVSSLLSHVEAMSEDRLASELSTAGCWAVCLHDDLYPAQLREVRSAPRALIGRGDTALLAGTAWKESVSIVGSRTASGYGREVARTLGGDLAAAGAAVISGLAFGTDACAHRGALETGKTVAIVGCGPDLAFPAMHRSLWRRITESGLVISELPPGTQAWRWTLSARERIIAGISGMTVVVEASKHSDSLVTAAFARDFDRELGAVPGLVTSRASVGTNGLLVEGVRPIRCATDVFDAMSGGKRGEEEPSPSGD